MAKKEKKRKKNSIWTSWSDRTILSNAPDRWRFDGTKLYMLFREGGASYLLVERASVDENEGKPAKIARLSDGREVVLWNENRSSRLAV